MRRYVTEPRAIPRGNQDTSRVESKLVLRDYPIVIRPWLPLVIVLTLAFAFLGACSKTPERPMSKFSGRVLLLTGDVSKGAALAELTQSDDGYQLTTLASGVTDAAASSDATRLVYATNDGISLRDLSSGAVTSLVKGASACLAWSTDGEHFSYQQHAEQSTKSYVSDVKGETKLVLDDGNGSTECARWVSEDRLIIDRFVGAMIRKGAQSPKPNTSTVVTIGSAVTLKDTPRKWVIESVCAKNNDGLVRSADEGRLLVAKNIDHFETIDPSPAPCSECRFIGYAAQSCTPFFIEQPTSTTTELFYLNPTNWQKQKPAAITWTFSAGAKFLIRSSARWMVVGDVPDKLLLIDTESGDVTPFFQKPAVGALNSPVPIVWVEK
jgi:hypothetical protein